MLIWVDIDDVRAELERLVRKGEEELAEEEEQKMKTEKVDGEQYCMYCNYWKRVDGRMRCTNSLAKAGWFANQVNGCDYFDGELQLKHDWSKAWRVGYRPSTFSK